MRSAPPPIRAASGSFTTQEYAVVDDFESYNDNGQPHLRHLGRWPGQQDRLASSAYWQAPFAEQTIIHGGKPVHAAGVQQHQRRPSTPRPTRTFDTPQDLTANGADSLTLYFLGYPVGFVDKGNNAFSVTSTGTDIWNNADQFRFVYKTLSGNGSITARVDSLTRSDAWSKAGVMIRESLDAGLQARLDGGDAGQQLLAAVSRDHRRRQRQHGLDRHGGQGPLLGPRHPHGQCVQDGDLRGRQDVDRTGPRSDGHDGGQRLRRSVRDQPQRGRLQHGGVLERRHHRHGQPGRTSPSA